MNGNGFNSFEEFHISACTILCEKIANIIHVKKSRHLEHPDFHVKNLRHLEHLDSIMWLSPTPYADFSQKEKKSHTIWEKKKIFETFKVFLE